MRHPLNWVIRLSVPNEDRQALLGDLEEEYSSRVRHARSRTAAQFWYGGQAIAAAWAYARGTPNADPRSVSFPLRIDDVRHALRRWRRRPGFPIAAALTLGLGIGAATAMFSVVDAVLLRPLPWPDSDRLAVIHGVYPERLSDPRFARTWNRSPLGYPQWERLRRAMSFEDVAVWDSPSLSMTIDEARTELVEVMPVSSNFLPMLGVRVIQGRNFDREDDERDTWNLILSYEAWQRRFGGRPEIVGKPSPIAYASDTHTPPWTIVGVLEPGFSFEGARPEVLQVIGGRGRQSPSFMGTFQTLGRMAPDVSVETASAEAAALVKASQREAPSGARVVPLQQEQVGSSARALWLLFGAASILLLVACANVAGLLVGENRVRRHDTAICLALGITRGGIVRQRFVEHALLAVAGAIVGLVLAAWLTQTLVALAPVELPRLDTVRIDWRVALFALATGSATLLVFGVAPALSLARTRAADMLADGGRQAAPARHVAQRTVVAAEIAMASVLVAGAGLMGETLFRLLSQPLGFNPSNLVVVSTRFAGSNIPPDWIRGTRGQNLNSGPPLAERTAAVRLARTRTVVERLAAVPGVVHAAGIGGPLFSRMPTSAFWRIVIDGRPPDGLDRATIRWVSGGFAETLRAPILAGRDLVPGDGRTAALVSRDFERRYFPDGAVGRQFTAVAAPGPGAQSADRVYEIVGVVGNLKHAYGDEPLPWVYAVGDTTAFVVRTAGDSGSIVPGIRHALAEVDRQIIVTGTTTVEASLSDLIAAERFRATLSTAFAAAALLLAVAGLYGVVARRVADRRRELGIRIALGARPAALQALVFRDGLKTVALGLSVGIPAAFAASQVTRAFVFGVSPTAPHVFLLASTALALAAVVATFLPARRASHVDPIIALRE
jgi:predicted permease